VRDAQRPLSGRASWVAAPAWQLRLPPPARRQVVSSLRLPEFGVQSAVVKRRAAPPLAVGTPSRAATVPSVGFSQQGISRGFASGAWDPADVSLAVGPMYVGEAVNASVGWWRIGAGFSTTGVTPLASFFTTSAVDRRSDNMSDPRLLYDASSGRWFFVAFDVSRTETDLAVSTNTDPTQPWLIYTLPAAGCPDQPRIAVSDTMVAITYNLFVSCASRVPPYIGGVVKLIDKQALLSGAAPANSTYGPDPRFIAITPAAPLDGGSTIYLVSTDYTYSQVVLYTASAVGQTSIPLQRIFVHLLQASPPPEQQGSALPLDSGDSRVQDAFVNRGIIWLAANDGCSVAGNPIQGCIRYLELSPAGQVLDEREESLANGRSDLYPAFRPDVNGNIFSIYGYSSAGDYPGLGVVIDPGRASGYLELKPGQGPDESGRWGDYFSAARDPSDGSRVWVAGAYGAPGGWGTFIAALSTAPFTIPNPTPTPPPPSGGGTGSGGGGLGGGTTDVSAPHAVALPSSGTVGSIVHLRYRLSDDSHHSRERIRIRHYGQVVASIETRNAPIVNGSVYFVTWKSPVGAPAALSFCVVSYDPSGNESVPSCAPLRLAGGR
jgi:hypothetical protein